MQRKADSSDDSPAEYAEAEEDNHSDPTARVSSHGKLNEMKLCTLFLILFLA